MVFVFMYTYICPRVYTYVFSNLWISSFTITTTKDLTFSVQ